METVIQEAGRQAMREALCQAVADYEAQHLDCMACGHAQTQTQGTVRRRVLTRFGRVILHLRRKRCGHCGGRFRPARGCLRALGRGAVTPELGMACAQAGASWPYATAAQVLHDLCGAQVSDEEVRRWTTRLGLQRADAQYAEAEDLLTPTAGQVRAERDATARAQCLGQRLDEDARAVPVIPVPDRLTAGLDGGCIPSWEQPGGMEGKGGWSRRGPKWSARMDVTASPRVAMWRRLARVSRWEA